MIFTVPVSNDVFSLELNAANPPSKSFKLDPETGSVTRRIDGMEAVKQAVFKILNTERYLYPIYSWDYGVELSDLFGEPYDYVCAESERRICEALEVDDRINSVGEFNFSRGKKGSVIVSFTVHSIYGGFDDHLEVKL